MAAKLSESVTQKIVDFIYGNSGYHGIVCDDTGTIIADSNAAQSRIGISAITHEQALANQEIAKLVGGVQLVSLELQSLSSGL